MTEPALRALLAGLIDYAGLFPPAALSMAEAVANYAGYRGGPDAWALGRFVVPAARLAEFEASAAPCLNGTPWLLSVLAEDRARFALSFGSCSFREPIDDLSALNLQ
jgi:hypothetical protein